jgi:hypothetical protein
VPPASKNLYTSGRSSLWNYAASRSKLAGIMTTSRIVIPRGSVSMNITPLATSLPLEGFPTPWPPRASPAASRQAAQ